jgi:hypothetical protein
MTCAPEAPLGVGMFVHPGVGPKMAPDVSGENSRLYGNFKFELQIRGSLIFGLVNGD